MDVVSIFSLESVIQVGITSIALGVFYGATKIELRWINKTLTRHEEKLDSLCKK